MTDVTLGGVLLSNAVPAALVMRITRPLVGTRRNVFVDVPGRAGSWVFPEQAGDRTLTVEVDIEGADFPDRRAAVRALADWADVGTVAQLIVDDEPDRFHEVILDAGVDVNEWLRYAGDISVPFRAGPYALSVVPIVESFSITGGSPAADTFEATASVDGLPIIQLIPTNGTMTGFTFELNDAAISYTGLVLALHAITISAISDTVQIGVNTDTELTGAFNPADVAMSSVIANDFPRVIPGTNSWALSWTGTATAVSLEITWRERYR